jgi:hypothetical protein
LRSVTSCFVFLIALSAVTFAQQPPPSPWRPERLVAPGLPNAIQLHEQVISGGLPEGDAAFAKLKELGVKTIISVDGARPDL